MADIEQLQQRLQAQEKTRFIHDRRLRGSIAIHRPGRWYEWFYELYRSSAARAQSREVIALHRQQLIQAEDEVSATKLAIEQARQASEA